MEIYLVRHGEKEHTPCDPPLTKRGFRQAQITGRYFLNNKITQIYSSPSLRARQTAVTIGSVLGKGNQYDDRLTERMNWDTSQYPTVEQFLEEWEKTDRNKEYIPQYGESSVGKGKRMYNLVTDIIKRHSDTCVLLITHGGAIGDFLRATFSPTVLPEIRIKESGITYIDIKECSVTHVRYANGLYSVVDIGSVDHLEKDLFRRARR